MLALGSAVATVSGLLTPSGPGVADAQTTHPEASVGKLTSTAKGHGAHPRTQVKAYRPRTDFYGADSEWVRDVSKAPLDADSAALAANLSGQVASRYAGVAAFNVSQYNVSFYSVLPRTHLVDVKFDDCQGKGYVPSQLYAAAGGAIFKDVPIPGRAIPASGADGELTLYDRRADTLWELWKAVKKTDGWHACWGGRIDNWSASRGYFSDDTGVTATGLSASAGAIGIKEAKAGRINHALSLNVVEAANWSDYSFPAQRSDGDLPAGTAHAIQEGRRFRLDPALDLDTLNLTPVARMVAKAAQKYGFIVNDKGGAVAVIAESGAGIQAATGRANPWQAMLEGVPGYAVMKGFPWSQLQALPFDYGKSS